MRLLSYEVEGRRGLAARTEAGWAGLMRSDAGYPGDLKTLLENGPGALVNAAAALSRGAPVDLAGVQLAPPVPTPGKIICVGLNYADHTRETRLDQPAHPTVFARFASSLVGHGRPLVAPAESEQLDFEGELVAVIGRRGRKISVERALEHVAGWSIFNDASVRDYQFKTSQWTLGKNFDSTGAFGPVFVSADELPAGARGLAIETRLNGQVVQKSNTADMIFDAASIIAFVSEAMTLEPGDLIVTGTPAGVGMGREPPLWMREGDVVEVEIEKIGVLRNPVVKARARP